MSKIAATIFIALTMFLIFCPGFSSAESDYKVGPGDVVKIDIYDHPDLATVARIGNDGSITLPLAGRLLIGGLSTSQAADVIAKSLAGDYVINPQVSVFVQEFKSKKVVIVGEVARPGLYELSRPTTLLELISQAGGPTRNAGQKAVINRPTGNKEGTENNTISVNIDDLYKTRDASADVSLMDGDTVSIEKAGVVYVTGHVRRPAAYPIEPGITVIKAITMAGGFTELAAEGKVKIIRKVDGSEQTLENVSLYEPILPNDVMVVPESFF